MSNIIQTQHKSPYIDANEKRYTELDIARGLSVVLMIVEHVNSYLTSEPLLQNPLFKLTQNGIADVAVIFMFLMGMNTVFSNRTTPRKILIRGCTILLVSYIFNFFRDFLPAYIGCSLHVSKLSDSGYSNLFLTVVNVDILQFVGLAFIFIGLLRICKISSRNELVIGIILSFLTIVFGKQETSFFIGNWFKDILIGGWNNNYFPFLSWIIFPICGAFLGNIYKNTNNKDLLYSRLIKYCFPIFIIGWCFILYFNTSHELNFYGWGDEMDYYRQNFFGNIFFLSETMLVLGIIYFLIKNDVFPKFITVSLIFWSKNISAIYIVSWLLISWLTWLVLGFNSIDKPYISIFMTIFIIILSHVIVKKMPIISKVITTVI